MTLEHVTYEADFAKGPARQYKTPDRAAASAQPAHERMALYLVASGTAGFFATCEWEKYGTQSHEHPQEHDRRHCGILLPLIPVPILNMSRIHTYDPLGGGSRVHAMV